MLKSKQMSDFDSWLKNGESFCCCCEEQKEVNVEYICEECFLPYDEQEVKDAQRYDEGKEISKGLCD